MRATHKRVDAKATKHAPCRLPYMGSLDAQVLLLIDPVVGNVNATKPLNKSQLQWLVSRLSKHGGFSKDDVCIASCAPPVTGETWGLGRLINAHLKEYRDDALRIALRPNFKLVLTFGAKATQQVVGRSVQITKVRGQIIHDDNILGGKPVLPLYSPFYAQRQPENEAAFISDLETAKRIVAAGFDSDNAAIEYKHDYRWCTDVAELKQVLKGKRKLSVDVETLGLDPYDPETKILTIQITYAKGKAIMVPIDYDRGSLAHHGFLDWSTINRRGLIRTLKRTLENPAIKVFGQNFKFDWRMLYHKLGIEVANYYGDTQLLAHLLDENQRRINLDDLVRQHVPEMAGFNDAHNQSHIHIGKSRMDLYPPDALLEYGCADTDAAWRLFHVLLKKVKKDSKLYACYRHVTMPAQRAFCYIEMNGFPVSVDALRKFEIKLRRIQKMERIYLLQQIPKSIKNKWKDSGVGLKVTRAAILRDWLYLHPDGLKLKPRLYTKTKEPSISSKQALPFYVADYPVIERLIQYIKNDKLLNTYAKGFYKYIRDGRIHPTYGLVWTVTGRSACIHADTEILTINGVKKASEIQVGDMVFTHKNRWRPVTKLFRKPVEEMYEVVLSNGSRIVCTEEHRFLTVNGTWETLKSVCIKNTHEGQKAAQARRIPLYEHLGYSTERCCPARFNDSYGNGDLTGRYLPQIQDGKVINVKTREQKPSEREAPSEPYRTVRRRLRLPNRGSGRETLLRASCSSCELAWAASEGFTEKYGSAPHRRRQVEQRPRQSSCNDTIRTCSDTREVQAHSDGVKIEEIYLRGSFTVFDFEVADDSSYSAAGVFNHNSRDPNGQNFPKRGELAKDFRNTFKAPDGWCFIQLDLSQAELRIAAMMSGDSNMLRVYKDGGDIHRATAAGVMGISVEEFLKLPPEEQSLKRFQAKAVNFGFLYGMWWVKFREYAKTDYGIDFTEDEAKEIREMFFRTYPSLEDWHRDVQDYVSKKGMIRTFDGRIRHLPNVFSPDESIAKQAMRQAINSPVQSIASDLGLMSLGRLIPYLRKTGYDDWLQPCGFIHDAVVCLVRKDKAAKGCRIVKRFMEGNPLYEWFGWEPEIPIIADAEIGETLGKTYEIPSEVFDSAEHENRSYDDIIRLVT